MLNLWWVHGLKKRKLGENCWPTRIFDQLGGRDERRCLLFIGRCISIVQRGFKACWVENPMVHLRVVSTKGLDVGSTWSNACHITERVGGGDIMVIPTPFYTGSHSGEEWGSTSPVNASPLIVLVLTKCAFSIIIFHQPWCMPHTENMERGHHEVDLFSSQSLSNSAKISKFVLKVLSNLI